MSTLEKLDHPLVFILIMTFAVFGTAALMVLLANMIGLPGLAAFFGKK